jgi:hypothetical protein
MFEIYKFGYPFGGFSWFLVIGSLLGSLQITQFKGFLVAKQRICENYTAKAGVGL